MTRTSPRGLILVAGAKKPGDTQHAGGVITATSVLMDSPFASHFRVYLIDSSAVMHPPESFLFKLRKGFWRLLQFVWICAAKRPQAALVWASGGFSLYEKLLLCGVCRIFRVRSAMLYVDSMYFERIEKSRLRRLHRFLFSIPNVLVCRSSTWIERYAALGIDPKRCVVIKNWIGLASYVSCRTPQPRGKDIVFLFVGWLIKEKGTNELVEAIRLVSSQLPGARWILVGGGKEEERLRAFVASEGLEDKVEIAGWKQPDQLYEYYRRANVLVLPSYGEGFPYAIIEAMSAGLPIITTPVGGIPGIFRDGKHGIFVPPRDAQKLADAMVRIAGDWKFRDEVSREVTEYVESSHDINVVWRELAQVLEGQVA